MNETLIPIVFGACAAFFGLEAIVLLPTLKAVRSDRKRLDDLLTAMPQPVIDWPIFFTRNYVMVVLSFAASAFATLNHFFSWMSIDLLLLKVILLGVLFLGGHSARQAMSMVPKIRRLLKTEILVMPAMPTTPVDLDKPDKK